MSSEPDPTDIYGRSARAANLQLAVTIVGSIVGIALIVGRVIGGSGMYAIVAGMLVTIPLAAIRIADPTRWGSLRDLGDTAEARKDFLRALQPRLADSATPTITTKYGSLYLLPDVLAFVDSADVEVVRIASIVAFTVVETPNKEQSIRVETESGRSFDVAMNRKDVAAAMRRLDEYRQRNQGRNTPVAA